MTRERLLATAVNCEHAALSFVAARCSRDVIAAAFHDAAEAWRALGRLDDAVRNDRNAAAYGWMS